MKLSRLSAIFLLAVLALAPLFAETDQEVKAHESALDLAGAFENDGFKTRDGHWLGTIKPGEKAIVAVNLYAGNQYWFITSTADDSKKTAVELFDETGHLVKSDPYDSENRTAAGFSPTNSGQYFVALSTQENAPATVCLIYSYK